MPRHLRAWVRLVACASALSACDAPPPPGDGVEEAPASANSIAEGDAQAARKRYRRALSRQDLNGARTAVADLERALAPNADAMAELARMLAAIGEMNRARWLLQDAVQQYPGRDDLVLGLAETSLRVGDGDGALRALEQIGSESEAYPYSRLLWARAQVALGDLEAGLTTLATAEAEFPETSGFRMERIEMLQVEQRHSEALALLRERQAEPELAADLRQRLALREVELVASIQGPEAALDVLDALLAADPASVELLQQRLALLRALGRPAKAVAEVEAGLAREPESSGLYALLAQARLAAGDVEGAEQALRDDVAREASVVSLTNLAHFLHYAGRSGEGADVLALLSELPDRDAAVESRYLHVAMLIEARRLSEARRRLAAFRQNFPGDARIDYLLARLDLAEGNPEAAAQKLTQAVAQLDRSDLKHLLGVALELSGDPEGAEQRYGIAVAQNPEQLPSWLGLLRTLEAQAKWQGLVEVAGKLIQVAPVSELAYSGLARAYLALGQPELAEAVLREYAERFPEVPGPRMALAFALRRQGRLEEALVALDEAERDFPGDAGLAAERAVVLGKLGRVEAGLAVVAAAGEAGAETSELRYAQLYLLLASGRRTEAMAEVDALSRENPLDARALVMAGDYLSSRGEFEKAAVRYAAALERGSREPGLAFRLGVAHDRAGQTETAIAAYRLAVEHGAEDVRAHNNLALVLQRQGQLPQALESAQAAYALADADPIVMDTLGFLYLEAGRAARAVALLERARAAEPNSAEVAYHLALAYRESGREAEARRQLAELRQQLEPGDELYEPVGKALASRP